MPIKDVLDRYGFDMVNYYQSVNIESLAAEIASVVSNDYVSSKRSPIARGIEYLIQVSIVAESGFTNRAADLQIPESLYKCR